MTTMRHVAALLALAAAVTIGALPVQADDYPARAVRIIVPFGAGGPTDVYARSIAEELRKSLQQTFIIENRPGAGTTIGTELVAKAAPDGYTLLFTATSFGTNPALTRNLPFDPVRSFAPVVLAATSSLAVIVNPQLLAKSLREFIDLARSQPGKLHYSSPGNGGPQHLAMELLKLETGIDVVHVPYKGAGGALADLIGGHVDAMISAVQTAAPHVQSGKLRMLAVMSGERSGAFPAVPTVKEAGLPELEVETWYGLLAPAGTPAAAIDRINGDINSLLDDAQIKELLARQGMSAAGGRPERLGELVKQELARWTRVVNAARIKAD
jgi:tripartite-type tricarboxylate transporter receptor subunit TctC